MDYSVTIAVISVGQLRLWRDTNGSLIVLELVEDEGLDQLDGQLHGVNAFLLVQVNITSKMPK